MLSVGKDVVFFSRFVAIFGKRYCSFSPKFCGKKFFCQNPFSAILKMSTELEGGGGA